MKLDPLKNQIFIRRAEKTTHYGHGIIEMAQKYYKGAKEGEVVSMGELDHDVLKVGHTIVYHSHADIESFEYDDEILTRISEKDVRAYWE